MEEFAELKTEHEETTAHYHSEKLAFQQEAEAFAQELSDCHSAKSEYLQELRTFQKAFRCDRVDGSQWEKIKSWKSWLAHYESEFSKELKAKYGAWVPPKQRATPDRDHYTCWHCGMKTFLGNRCLNFKCAENQVMRKEKEDQQKEFESLKEKEEELQNQANQDKASPNVQIFIDKLKSQLAACEETNQEQDKQFQKLLEQKKHLYTEAEEYGKQIVDYGFNMDTLEKQKSELQKEKSDLEKERDSALQAIDEQNEAVKSIVVQERKQKRELQQATQQIGTLKQMHIDNLAIQKKQRAEADELRKQLQACEEKMQQLGIEQDKQNLQDATKLSETAEAAEATAETTEATAATTAPAPKATSPTALPVKASPAKTTSEGNCTKGNACTRWSTSWSTFWS